MTSFREPQAVPGCNGVDLRPPLLGNQQITRRYQTVVGVRSKVETNNPWL